MTRADAILRLCGAVVIVFFAAVLGICMRWMGWALWA